MITNDRLCWACVFNDFLCTIWNHFKIETQNWEFRYCRIVLISKKNSCVARVTVSDCAIVSISWYPLCHFLFGNLCSFAMSTILRHFPHTQRHRDKHKHTSSDDRSLIRKSQYIYSLRFIRTHDFFSSFDMYLAFHSIWLCHKRNGHNFFFLLVFIREFVFFLLVFRTKQNRH